LGWEREEEVGGARRGPYAALIDALECVGTTCAVVSLLNQAQIYRLIAEEPCRAVVSRLTALLVCATPQNSIRAKQPCCPSAATAATDVDCRDAARATSPDSPHKGGEPAVAPPSATWKRRLRASAARLWGLARLGQVPTPVIVAGVLVCRGLWACAALS
jgi:hypothetical protein